ncbi:MAG TPA: Rieske 2Fe-2S domain-containing protein [Phycisphaerae bacterium]|nr:Rieske 2Fe-2S domain-containing protein [Phycisphaerae bacterium]HNU43865.1 Rieske 2Fe-2S domain-containing protein [Phycisphaerae bacterium]
MAWIRLLSLEECRPGRGTFVEAAGRKLAVFLHGAPPRPAVIDSTCPHAGGNLAGGTVEAGTVSCPWHQWTFDLTTGACTHNRLARVRTYPAEVRDAAVWADLPG